MAEWLTSLTELAIAIIELMALVIILVGAIHAFVGALRLMLIEKSANLAGTREVWLGFARVLVAGLTFQLAADILESAIAPDWDSVGRLAAIAVIRTFLNYFLERDLVEVRETSASEPGKS